MRRCTEKRNRGLACMGLDAAVDCTSRLIKYIINQLSARIWGCGWMDKCLVPRRRIRWHGVYHRLLLMCPFQLQPLGSLCLLCDWWHWWHESGLVSVYSCIPKQPVSVPHCWLLASHLLPILPRFDFMSICRDWFLFISLDSFLSSAFLQRWCSPIWTLPSFLPCISYLLTQLSFVSFLPFLGGRREKGLAPLFLLPSSPSTHFSYFRTST